jgi:tRNA U34 5-methylaminomethyl-2-thiouridine-forming methyltransferase MnmC
MTGAMIGSQPASTWRNEGDCPIGLIRKISQQLRVNLTWGLDFFVSSSAVSLRDAELPLPAPGTFLRRRLESCLAPVLTAVSSAAILRAGLVQPTEAMLNRCSREGKRERARKREEA